MEVIVEGVMDRPDLSGDGVGEEEDDEDGDEHPEVPRLKAQLELSRELQ